jgi:hypothetical protein
MAIKLINCIVCDESFQGSSSALYCSGKCKQSSYRGKFARSGYIYKLMNGKEVVYVGQSRTMEGVKGIVRNHKSGEDRKIFDGYDYEKVDGDVLSEVESRVILEFNPKYNKVLPKNTTYKSLSVASKSLLHVMDEIIISLCDTKPLGDEGSEHLRYIKSCEIDKLKSKILNKLVNGVK